MLPIFDLVYIQYNLYRNSCANLAVEYPTQFYAR